MAIVATVEGMYIQSTCGSVEELLLFSSFETVCIVDFLRSANLPATNFTN